jgi:hypothetical protein
VRERIEKNKKGRGGEGWKQIFRFYLTEPNTHDTASPQQGWTIL